MGAHPTKMVRSFGKISSKSFHRHVARRLRSPGCPARKTAWEFLQGGVLSHHPSAIVLTSTYGENVWNNTSKYPYRL